MVIYHEYHLISHMIPVLFPFSLVVSFFHLFPWFIAQTPDFVCQDGFWEVSVQAVRLGNRTVDSCESGCRGIIDTGASR